MPSVFFTPVSESPEIWFPERADSHQRLLYESIRRFADVSLPPHEAALEAHDYDCARMLFRECAALGVFSAEVDTDDDGLGLGVIDTTLICEALGRAHSLNVGFMVHQGVGMLPVACFGTSEQRSSYLPGAMSGDTIMAFALTEPHCGSDALALSTSAVEEGAYYLLNGAKQFITNAGYADCFITFARVPERGITSFLVDAHTSGITIGPEEKKLGQHASSTCSVFFENVRVPRENVLGDIGKGHLIALNMLNLGRLKLAAACVGKMKALLPQAVQYTSERNAFGHPIIQFGMLRERLARMASLAFVAESMVYRIASLMEHAIQYQRGDRESLPGAERLAVLEDFALECALVKSFVTESLGVFTDDMLQLYGGYGFSEEYPAAKAYRDARVTRLYEGTTEICRLTALRRLFAASESLPTPTEHPDAKDPWLSSIAKTMLARYLRVYTGGNALALTQPDQELTGELAVALEQAYAIESGWLRCRALPPDGNLARDLVAYFEAGASPAVYGPLSTIHSASSEQSGELHRVFWSAAPFGSRAASRDRVAEAIAMRGGVLPGSL